jgi:excinuclease ABC subunit C
VIKIVNEYLKEKIAKIPLKPGIYMMKDKEGKIIYIGKAILLKKRVMQYFQKNNKSKRIEKMVSLIENISFIVTSNEVEALVLECNYIKEHNPKFNVMLKDDKTYPYIKINIKDKYPTIYITRTKKEDKALYFGPYTNVGAVREVLKMIKQIFPLKRCKLNLEKNKINSPCLYYHIGRCLGPCINDVNLETYREMINQIVLFLQGKTNQITKLIKKEIEENVEKLEFEKASLLKQRLDNIEKIGQKQQVANLNENSTDIFGYILEDTMLYIQVFKIRNYKIVLNDNVEIKDMIEEEVEEALTQVISSYYIKTQDIPKKIYVNIKDENIELLNDFFKNQTKNITIICPKKGDKLKLIKMVENNIKINIEDKKNNVVEDLSKLLSFSETIDSIECYDISNIKNEYIVGCMIRFEDGKLNKKMYRKFKIKSTYTQDDPKCIYEILTRRLKHHKEWLLPDLILIDGGKTQLSMAKKALESIDENTNLYGMVKNDKHKTRGLIDILGNEINLEKDNKILNFLTFLQDEVHRFTISYHRKLRDTVKLKDDKKYTRK